MLREIGVSVYRAPTAAFLDIIIWKAINEDTIAVYRPVKPKGGLIRWDWEEQDIGDMSPEPTMRIPTYMEKIGILQQMVDGIADSCGVLAKKAEESTTALEYQGRHLEDLRAMIFQFDDIRLERGGPFGTEQSTPENDRTTEEAGS